VPGLPLLLAIVGQRQIVAADESRIGDAVRSIVDELRGSYPHTEIVVVSPLLQRSEQVALEAVRAAQVRVFETGEPAMAQAAIAVSQLLLLLWDGDLDQTEINDVVRGREGRSRNASHRPLEPPDVAPYFRLVTPCSPSAAGPNAYEVVRHFPERYPGDSQSEDDFNKALRSMDRYNRDLAAEAGGAAQTTPEELQVRTDALAQRLQKSTHRGQGALYAIALFAAILQVVVPASPWWLKVAAIVTTLAVYNGLRRAGIQSRYQDYRAIAEALRVQLAWWEARIDLSVDGAYLRTQQSELQWIRMLLRVAAFLHRPDSIRSGAPDPDPLRHWIDEQRSYFQAASNRTARIQALLQSTVGTLVPVYVVLSLAVGIFLALWHGSPDFESHLRWASGAFAALGAVIAALLTSYSRTRAFSEDAKRYRRMYLLFDEAQRELHAAIDAKEEVAVRELAVALGREALAEQAEWLLTQRERPVGIVQTAAGQL
jgi:hypothetical protein